MKTYDKIGLQITLISLLFYGTYFVGVYANTFFPQYIAFLILVLVFSPSPYNKWRTEQIEKELRGEKIE
jgi:hypothetical protein